VTDVVARLTSLLADRYRIERELGRGGMATVYLARDVRHKRVVALKVLAPALGAALGPERFRREIELAAQLQHPHIVPVFDSGEDGELLWYTMPFVDGESLRDRLSREGPLALTEVLSIVREVASALDYAHRKGVVHRDIKPENILLSDGQALVADFGIARSAGPAEERLTVTGLSLGTPSYMSPEQITGDAVDGRADQYALGCLVYELLAGRPPYSGPSVQAVIAKHMTDLVPLLGKVRPEVPAATEAAVARAMAKSPADRFSSAAQFASALAASPAAAPAVTAPTRRDYPRAAALVAGTIALVLIIVGGLWWSHRSAGDLMPPEGPQVVAVQPFTADDGHSGDYFTEGVTDAVQGAFTGVGALRGVAAANSNQDADSTHSPRKLARALGATYVLTGRVRRLKQSDSSAGVEVDARLLRGSDGRETWHRKVGASAETLSSIGGRVVEAVAPALGQRLTDSVRARLRSAPTRSVLAYDAYLRGQAAERALLNSMNDPAGHAEAVRYFEQAVALDTTFARAWSELSSALVRLYFAGAAKTENAPRALAAARRAIALAPRDPAGYLALGEYYSTVPEDNDRAARELGTARQLTPDDVRVLRQLIYVEQGRDNWPTAIMLNEQLSKLQPDDPKPLMSLGFILFLDGRYSEAATMADRALALTPGDVKIWRIRMMAAVATGDWAQIRSTLDRARRATAPAELTATLAGYEMSWILDDTLRGLLRRLRPAAFGGNLVNWAESLALDYWVAGDTTRARAYADSALPALHELERNPSNARNGFDWTGHALAYGVLGRRAEAERFARRAERLSPWVKDVNLMGVSVQIELVQMDVFLGQRESAVQRIERVRSIDPGFYSPGELRLNPLFRSLRDLPSFQRLLAGG
jgi:eukaryotic-like serine/threonine-protein kinase